MTIGRSRVSSRSGVGVQSMDRSAVGCESSFMERFRVGMDEIEMLWWGLEGSDASKEVVMAENYSTKRDGEEEKEIIKVLGFIIF